jgi:hypothetical protein
MRLFVIVVFVSSWLAVNVLACENDAMTIVVRADCSCDILALLTLHLSRKGREREGIPGHLQMKGLFNLLFVNLHQDNDSVN